MIEILDDVINKAIEQSKHRKTEECISFAQVKSDAYIELQVFFSFFSKCINKILRIIKSKFERESTS